MKTEPELLTPDAFAPGGPTSALADRLGLSSPTPGRRMLRVGLVILALLVLHLPLLAFSGRMIRCRQRGLIDFAALVLRYDRAFEARWIEHATQADRESILGHPDFQALVGVATAYDHVNEMRPIPFDTRAFVVLALAAAVPMIPLLGAAIPFREILLKLGEMMI